MPPAEYDARRPRIPEDLAARVDAQRGQVPFNRFVVEALEKALGDVTPIVAAAIGGGRSGGDSSPTVRSSAPPRASEPPAEIPLPPKVPVRCSSVVRRHGPTCRCPVCLF